MLSEGLFSTFLLEERHFYTRVVKNKILKLPKECSGGRGTERSSSPTFEYLSYEPIKTWFNQSNGNKSTNSPSVSWVFYFIHQYKFLKVS
jgi:hypothetical protein